MKRLIVLAASLCLVALTAGCGGSAHGNTLAYIANSAGTGFTVYTVNTDGTLSLAGISPQTTPAPLMLQFSPNGKWAYFLDAAGQNIYAYTRSGSGTLETRIDQYPLAGTAHTLAVSANSEFVYVAQVVSGQDLLTTYSIDQATGILTQVGTSKSIGYNVTQLIMSPDGAVLYGLAPSSQTVITWRLSATSGDATQADTETVGSADPEFMILSANGSFLYVLDKTGTAPNTPNVATGGSPGDSPEFYGFTTTSTGQLQLMPGNTATGSQSNAFTENADLLSGEFPQEPVAGATSNDSRYLFIVNQGTSNISIFSLDSQSGYPTEVTGAVVLVNGVPTSTASPFPCGDGCRNPNFLAVSKLNNAVYVLTQGAPATATQAATSAAVFQNAVDQNTGRIRPMSTPSVPVENPSSAPTWITIR